jgi:hypothetical protein
MIGFIIGVFVGAFLGIAIMAILSCSKSDLPEPKEKEKSE